MGYEYISLYTASEKPLYFIALSHKCHTRNWNLLDIYNEVMEVIVPENSPSPQQHTPQQHTRVSMTEHVFFATAGLENAFSSTILVYGENFHSSIS